MPFYSTGWDPLNGRYLGVPYKLPSPDSRETHGREFSRYHFQQERIVADQLPVPLSFAVPYSSEFKRAIDSAILRCSSANPTFRNAIEPISSDGAGFRNTLERLHSRRAH
jgi:hypothetical protein